MKKITAELLLSDAREADKEFEEAMNILYPKEFNLKVLPEPIKRKVEEFAYGAATIVEITQLINQYPYYCQQDFMKEVIDYLNKYSAEYDRQMDIAESLYF